MPRVRRQDQHRLNLVIAQRLEQLHRIETRFGLDLSWLTTPQLFDLLTMLLLGDHATVGKDMAQRACVPHTATRVGLAGQREGCGARDAPLLQARRR